MPEQSLLEGVQWAFRLLFPLAVLAGTASAIVTRRRCLTRALCAVGLAVAAQHGIEAWQAAPLTWWQHLGIDFSAFVIVTLPPRHYWQATLGALIFAQLVLHACWAMAPDLARYHWLGVTLIEIAKCGVLIGWAGGKRVERLLGRAAGAVARLVPDPIAGKPA